MLSATKTSVKGEDFSVTSSSSELSDRSELFDDFEELSSGGELGAVSVSSSAVETSTTLAIAIVLTRFATRGSE